MSCEVKKKNMGASRCNKMPGRLTSMIWTPKSFVIPKAIFNDPEAILALLNNAIRNGAATRIYKFPDFKSFEPINKDAANEDTPYELLPVDDGQYRWRFGVRQNMCTHKAMYSHRTSEGRVIMLDHLDQLFGTELSNGDGAGLGVGLINTEKMIMNDGTAAAKSPFVLTIGNNLDIDKRGLLLDFGYGSELLNLVDVVITVVNVTASIIQVKVNAECDSTGIDGLIKEDFLLKTLAGATQAIPSMTPLGNGEYRLQSVGAFVDGTLELVPVATQTLKIYEAIEPVEIDVPS